MCDDIDQRRVQIRVDVLGHLPVDDPTNERDERRARERGGRSRERRVRERVLGTGLDRALKLNGGKPVALMSFQ